MALSSKKVIARLHSGDHLSGYLPPTSFLRSAPSLGAATLDLLDLAGRNLPVLVSDLKYIAFVRDFNLDDPQNPERLTRRAFLSRPRSEGLWLRLTFPAGDHLEGLAPLDTSLLDALLVDAGIFLTPPDDRTNTHRIYVPRVAIATLQFVAVITTPSRTKPLPTPETQTNLFPSPDPPIYNHPMLLADLAQHLDATLHGDPQAEITGVAGIEDARPGHLTFVANPRYAARARTTQATAILVEPAFPAVTAATLRTPNPYLAFARAIELFYTPPTYPPGIHPTAVIAASATIGPHAHIGPYAVIGEDVQIGPHATILAHAVLYQGVRAGSHLFLHAHAILREHCVLGDHVTIQNGAIIGADGFGFARQQGPDQLPGGPWYKILQSGPAILEENVEVQANACIDRASIGETRIQAGAKIDNLVQVGHGSNVGPATLLCAQVGLAGSTTIGRNVILAGQVGVAGHCTIGDGAIATAQSGIPSDVPPGKTVSGYPAIDNRQWLRSVALFNKLPELIRTLKQR